MALFIFHTMPQLFGFGVVGVFSQTGRHVRVDLHAPRWVHRKHRGCASALSVVWVSRPKICVFIIISVLSALHIPSELKRTFMNFNAPSSDPLARLEICKKRNE